MKEEQRFYIKRNFDYVAWTKTSQDSKGRLYTVARVKRDNDNNVIGYYFTHWLGFTSFWWSGLLPAEIEVV